MVGDPLTGDVRTVLGLTAEAWCLGVAAVVVIGICLDSIAYFLASASAARLPHRERRSSIPAVRR